MRGRRRIDWIPFAPLGGLPDPVVWVDVQKVDMSWKNDGNCYVGPDGQGQSISPARYARFGQWVRHGLAVEMPQLGFDAGEVSFTDGRHRFAWLRDHGMVALPITVAPENATEMGGRFGTTVRASYFFDK